jgi:hypothetical protein
MKYRLRYQQNDFELNEGSFLIGRGADCQLALDDALVSRSHALLTVNGDALYVEDKGSRNGVRVNGDLITDRTFLSDGDRIRIGSQEMIVLSSQSEQPHAIGQPAPTLKADAFGLLGGLAEKAMAMGRGDEAERILSVHLNNVLADAKRGRKISEDLARQATLYAVKVAAASGKGRWVDYVFEVYSVLELACPIEVVDELYVAVRKVSVVNVSLLREYIGKWRERAHAPAERFLLSRLEGLGQLIALK